MITPSQAYDIASQWGSYVYAGDPGAVFYSFPVGNASPQDEEHRQKLIAYTKRCLEEARRRVAEEQEEDVEDLEELLEFFEKCPLDPVGGQRLTFRHPSSGEEVEYGVVEKAVGDFYSMSLVGVDARIVEEVVNQGIDACLESCFVRDRGDEYVWTSREVNGRPFVKALDCRISAKSMPTLLRRLCEIEGTGEDGDDADVAETLVRDILEELGIDEGGILLARAD